MSCSDWMLAFAWAAAEVSGLRRCRTTVTRWKAPTVTARSEVCRTALPSASAKANSTRPSARMPNWYGTPSRPPSTTVPLASRPIGAPSLSIRTNASMVRSSRTSSEFCGATDRPAPPFRLRAQDWAKVAARCAHSLHGKRSAERTTRSPTRATTW